MNTKKSYLSWTLWVQFVAAGGALFYPPVAEFISSHPSECAIAFAMVNVVLRFVTKKKIELY